MSPSDRHSSQGFVLLKPVGFVWLKDCRQKALRLGRRFRLLTSRGCVDTKVSLSLILSFP